MCGGVVMFGGFNHAKHISLINGTSKMIDRNVLFSAWFSVICTVWQINGTKTNVCSKFGPKKKTKQKVLLYVMFTEL